MYEWSPKNYALEILFMLTGKPFGLDLRSNCGNKKSQTFT